MIKKLLIIIFLPLILIGADSRSFFSVSQRLPTSGARELTPFVIGGEHYIAVSQLAKDNVKEQASMNGGNSDVPVLVYKANKQSHFILWQTIPSHGNEGSSFFQIDGQSYLAVASIRSGPSAPYNMQTYSKLYHWDGHYFYPIQQFFALATKQMFHFNIGDQHFLAQANGVSQDESGIHANSNSMIHQWQDHQFVPFQEIPSTWAYSWEFFKLDGDYWLALADHVGQSTLFKWKNSKFVPVQTIKESGGRAFKFMRIDGKALLAYANIEDKSRIYQYNGKRFEVLQELQGAGGRNFTYFNNGDGHFLLRINFIEGGREDPQTVLQSPIYRWNGQQFEQKGHLVTSGGVSAELFEMNGQQFLALANSLSADIRFRVDSLIYHIHQISGEPRGQKNH